MTSTQFCADMELFDFTFTQSCDFNLTFLETPKMKNIKRQAFHTTELLLSQSIQKFRKEPQSANRNNIFKMKNPFLSMASFILNDYDTEGDASMYRRRR